MAETYTTTDLAIAFLGDDAIEANRKGATRITRRFLRDEFGEGKAVVGKGSRYALPLTKRELTALAKKFKAWQIADEEAKAQRADALAAARAPKATPATLDLADAPQGDDDAADAPLDLDDDADPTPDELTDEAIAAMLADDTDD